MPSVSSECRSGITGVVNSRQSASHELEHRLEKAMKLPSLHNKPRTPQMISADPQVLVHASGKGHPCRSQSRQPSHLARRGLLHPRSFRGPYGSHGAGTDANAAASASALRRSLLCMSLTEASGGYDIDESLKHQ